MIRRTADAICGIIYFKLHETALQDLHKDFFFKQFKPSVASFSRSPLHFKNRGKQVTVMFLVPIIPGYLFSQFRETLPTLYCTFMHCECLSLERNVLKRLQLSVEDICFL